MTSVEKLLSVTDVFFHQNCPDGTAAAVVCAAAFRLLGTEPKFRPLQYGTGFMERLEPRPGQLFVDITPPLARWREWEAVSPLVLDHHETAREATEGLGGRYATNEHHSGAMLAFESVLVPAIQRAWPYEYGAPELEEAVAVANRWHAFAELAMVRDTWKRSSPLWDGACAQAEALVLMGAQSLVESVRAGEFDEAALMSLGRTLLDKARRKAEFAAERAEWSSALVGGRDVRIATFNCTEKITSDVANLLIEQGANVAAGYFYTVEDGAPRLCVSVRSDGSVSARSVAEANGGGGHDRAAGFNVPSAAPSEVASRIRSALWRAARG